MWGHRPQTPAKGTCPFGIPETFHFAGAGTVRRATPGSIGIVIAGGA